MRVRNSKSTQLRGGWVFLASALVCTTSLSVSQADVVLDGTMGGSGALAGPNFTIDAVDGTTIGSNLFHSFSEFNLTAAQSATFTNTTAAVISNVLGRITDTSPSTIDGRIASTIPNANLFLMNPQGFIFGPNATLDVQGAFHATTADYIGLADGTHFNAVPSGADTLLTTAAPAAFGFLGTPPGAITVDHSQLSMPQGQTLSLVGGDLSVIGTDLNTNNASLRTDGGTINLISVASPGEATLASAINADAFTDYGTITVAESTIDVSGNTSGSVYIQGGQIVLDTANVLSNTGTGDGGNLTVVGDSVLVDNLAILSSSSFSGEGNAGDVTITADHLEVRNGGIIEARPFGAGNGGNLLIDAGTVLLIGGVQGRDTGLLADTFGSGAGGDVTVIADSVLVDHGANISSSTLSAAPAGDITVTTSNLEVRDNATISSSSFGEGRAGDVTIEADNILLVGDGTFSELTGIAANARTTGSGGDVRITANSLALWDGAEINVITMSEGNGGAIGIDVGYLAIRNGAKLNASTFGAGRGGDISVNADSLVVASDGSSDLTLTGIESTTFGSGDAGNISVNVLQLDISDSAEIASNTEGLGRAGDITVAADSVLMRNGARITADTEGSGRGGNVTVKAGNLEIRSSSRIGADADSGEGSAGAVIIEAERVLLSADGVVDDATAIATVALPTSSGDGGNILITAGSLEIRGGIIASTAVGTGRGGDITIETDMVLLDGGGVVLPSFFDFAQFDEFSVISASSLLSDSGAAGNITIAANTIELRDGGVISSLTASANPGGDVNVSASRLLVGTDARIEAGTSGVGHGGTVTIQAADVLLAQGGEITTESIGSGGAGDIFVSADQTFQSRGGSVTTRTTQSDGGNVQLTVGELVHLVDSEITAAVQGGAGAGGNILIDPQFLVLNKSQISANAFGGPGGNINIQAGNAIISADSSITASSALGFSGTVVVESPENDIAGSISQLAQTFLDATTLLPESCASRKASGQSSFVVAGRGGVAPNPDGYLPSFNVVSLSPSKTAKVMSLESTVALKDMALASLGCRQ